MKRFVILCAFLWALCLTASATDLPPAPDAPPAPVSPILPPAPPAPPAEPAAPAPPAPAADKPKRTRKPKVEEEDPDEVDAIPPTEAAYAVCCVLAGLQPLADAQNMHARNAAYHLRQSQQHLDQLK